MLAHGPRRWVAQCFAAEEVWAEFAAFLLESRALASDCRGASSANCRLAAGMCVRGLYSTCPG